MVSSAHFDDERMENRFSHASDADREALKIALEKVTAAAIRYDGVR